MLEKLRENASRRPLLARLLITLTVSVIFVAVFNEVTYMLQKEDFDRLPKTVQLVIPKGTAALVAAGNPAPGIPEEMVFVLGDVLEVRNEDVEAHQLGPLWVPPGGVASLLMEEPNKYNYACSFQPSKYLGMEVRRGTTLNTRITAMLLAAPTLTALLFIYSVALWPIKGQKEAPAKEKGPAKASGGVPGLKSERLESNGRVAGD